MSIRAFFNKAETEVSAFVKVAQADAQELEAKGKIATLDAFNKAKTEIVAFYQKEAARVHAESDKIKSNFDTILAKL